MPDNDARKELCFGYMEAVSDIADGLVGVNVCTPQDATVRQIVDVGLKYLTDHPGERHRTAYTIVIGALAEVFPCPKRSPAILPPH